MTIDELKREALRLDVSERAGLARDLLESLEDLSEVEAEKLWLEEAVRRDEEIRSGAVKAIPMEEALSKARARLR